MRHFAPLAIVALATSTYGSPLQLGAEAAYTTGSWGGSDALHAFALHADGAYAVLPQLTLHGRFSVVRVTITEEGEDLSDNGFANPSLLARYAILRDRFRIGATTGVIAKLAGDLDAANIYTDFEAARRPYELGGITAVPFVLDAAYVEAPWHIGIETGAYFVADDGPQLDDIHVAFDVAYERDAIRAEGSLHALFVPAVAESPTNFGEPTRRAYYGIEIAVSWPVHGEHRVRLALWKPFGYDESDAAVRAVSFSAGTELQF